MGNQKPRSEQEHLSILKGRGMQFDDDQKALSFLSRVSYFRLKYYRLDMLDGQTENDFIAGTQFSKVVERYEFDRELRQIMFEAVGILEIGLRTKIINPNRSLDRIWLLLMFLFCFPTAFVLLPASSPLLCLDVARHAFDKSNGQPARQ